jgi:hypothetical protein
MGTTGIMILLGVALYLLIILGILCLVPAVQAKRRGYSFFVWFFAGLVAFNPIFLLIVLASVPHRRRQKLRERFRHELDAKLAAAGAPAVAADRPVSDRSLGDQPTLLPGAAASTADASAPDRSLGDAPTVPPDARSLGDEVTRL